MTTAEVLADKRYWLNYRTIWPRTLTLVCSVACPRRNEVHTNFSFHAMKVPSESRLSHVQT